MDSRQPKSGRSTPSGQSERRRSSIGLPSGPGSFRNMGARPCLPSRPSRTSLVIGPGTVSPDAHSSTSGSPPRAKGSPSYVGDSNISLPYGVTIGGREFFRKDESSGDGRAGLRQDGGEWKLPERFPIPRDFDEGSAASRVEAADVARAVKRASSSFDISDPSNTQRNRNQHGLSLRIPVQSMHSFAGHSPQSSAMPSPGGGRRLHASPSAASLNATLAEQSPAGAPGSPYSNAGGSPTWGESSMSAIVSRPGVGGVRSPGGSIVALSPGGASTHSLTGSQGFDQWDDSLMHKTREFGRRSLRRISHGSLGRFIRSGKRNAQGLSSPTSSVIGSPISPPHTGLTGPFPVHAGPYGYETRTDHGSDAGSGAVSPTSIASPASTTSLTSLRSTAPPAPARSPAPRQNRQRSQPRMVSGLYSAGDGGRSEVELSFSVTPESGHASPTEGSISPISSVGTYGAGSRNSSATHLPQAMSPNLQDSVIEELEEPGPPGKVPTSGGVRYRRPQGRRLGSSLASPTDSAATGTTPRMPVSPQAVRTPTADTVRVLPEAMPKEEAIPNDNPPRRARSPSASSQSTSFTDLETPRHSPTTRYTFFEEDSDVDEEVAQPDVRGSGRPGASVVSIVDNGGRSTRYYNPKIKSYRTSRNISQDMTNSESATPTMAAHGRQRTQMARQLEEQSSSQRYMVVERLENDEPSGVSDDGERSSAEMDVPMKLIRSARLPPSGFGESMLDRSSVAESSRRSGTSHNVLPASTYNPQSSGVQGRRGAREPLTVNTGGSTRRTRGSERGHSR